MSTASCAKINPVRTNYKCQCSWPGAVFSLCTWFSCLESGNLRHTAQ